MADWDEIKRLAADFQKVQLSSNTQRLSERNCIEIVTWLLNKKLIDLIFTSDGKEYLTPTQLVTEIRNKLYESGGRINHVELAKSIGVDLFHISAHLHDVQRGHNIISIVGQLIDSTYITTIAGEINEKLSQQGHINTSDLTIHYDLPAEFLQQHVLEPNFGKLILGKQDENDPKVIYTESFIARTKAKIKGALMGVTRPVSVASLLSHIDISESLFFSLFEQSTMFGTLTSRLPGAQYIPNIYAKSQNDWVNNFYKQNGYLEFDALTRLGITDAKAYVKKQLGNENVLILNSCIVSQQILERVEGDIDECISSKSFVDLENTLPSVFNEEDRKLILDKVLTKQKQDLTIVIEHCVFSKSYAEELLKRCEETVKAKSQQIVESGEYQKFQMELQIQQNKSHKLEEVEEKVDKREERRKKAAGGKSGGGTQGRETKTKSTKKFNKAQKHVIVESDDEPEKINESVIVTANDVRKTIESAFEETDLNDYYLDPIIEYLLPKLNEQGLEIASNIYAAIVADRTSTKRQTHNEVQNKLNNLIGDIRLFDKGVKLLPADLQPQLYKYLLKTLCTEVVTDILNYIAGEQNSNITADNFTHEQRLKFVGDLPQEYKVPLLPLLKTLTGQSIEEFMTCVEEALTACSMIIKKIDKKKDRTIILNHKYELLDQLNKCEDIALVLHLATIFIFTTVTNCMLHASGRHVSVILSFLKQYLSEEQYSELSSYYDFVTLMLSGGSEAENAKEKLKEKVPVVKNIANEFKKPASGK